MNIAAYKKRLEDEKAALELQMSEPPGKGREDEPDILDIAKNAQNYEEEEGVEHDLEGRYSQVIAALERIEAGEYGICEVGGEEIEEERLDADPAAATCIAHLK